MQFLLLILYSVCITVWGDEEDYLESAKAYFQDAENTTIFYLFTSLNPTYPQILSLHDLAVLESSNFNSDWPTRILIDGWSVHNTSNFNIQLREAYLRKGDYNVIIVDWGAGGRTQFLPLVYKNAKIAGKVIAKFIDEIQEELSLDLTNLYLIGFGVGAHVSGFVGKYITNGKISNIIALDPIGVGFFVLDKPAERLTSNDAHHVQAIHTNSYLMGFPEPIGAADFYANYGILQPGCNSSNIITCSHVRSYEYFIESINSVIGFAAQRCNNYKEILLEARCTGDDINFTYQVGGEPIREYEGVFQFKTIDENTVMQN